MVRVKLCRENSTASKQSPCPVSPRLSSSNNTQTELCWHWVPVSHSVFGTRVSAAMTTRQTSQRRTDQTRSATQHNAALKVCAAGPLPIVSRSALGPKLLCFGTATFSSLSAASCLIPACVLIWMKYVC